MKMIQKVKKSLPIFEKLRGKISREQFIELVCETCVLKIINAYAASGRDEKLQALGLKKEIFNNSYFKDLTKAELSVIIKEVRKSSKVSNIFTVFEEVENLLEEEQFKALMDIVDQLDFVVTLQKPEGNFEIGNAFRELVIYYNELRRREGVYLTAESLRKLIVKLNSLVKAKSIYSPAMGAGILTVEVAEANKIPDIYGQEMGETEAKLCKMLLIAYGYVEQIENIQVDDTFSQALETSNANRFDKIVSVLPFGLILTAEMVDKAAKIYPGRWTRQSGEMLFIYHILNCLAQEGMASILVSNGVLFRGGAEAEMRQKLLEENCIDCIIQLPNKMLTHIGIPTALMILKKNRNRQEMLFMDLTGEVSKVSRLTTQFSEETIQKAFNLYQNYEDSSISRVVPVQEVLDNESNLSVKRYIGVEEKEVINLEEVNQTIETLEQELRVLQAKIKSKL